MDEHKDEHGLNKCLKAIDLPKSTYYYRKNQMVSYTEKYKHLREPMHNIAEENADYGYPRMTPELQEQGYDVGEYVVSNLMDLFGIRLMNNVDKPPQSEARKFVNSMGNGCNIVKKLDTIKPLQVFYTDYTEIFFDNGNKKGYLMALLDHSGKLVPGYALEKRKNTDTALKAIKRTASTLKELGHTLKGKIIHHDQDPVYTGYKWMREVLFNQSARISYSENGARGNSIIEAFHSSLKRENKDLFLEARNIWELKRVVKERIEYYNQERRHSTLGQVAPLIYLKREKILPEETESLAQIGA